MVRRIPYPIKRPLAQSIDWQAIHVFRWSDFLGRSTVFVVKYLREKK